HARLHVVREVSAEHLLAKDADEVRIADGEHHLDPAVQIPRHEAGASEEALLVAAVPEPEDAAVLEEAAHDGDDPDRFRDSGDARTQAAHPPDDEIDLPTGLGGPVEQADDPPVHQRVHLEDDVPLPALALMLDLTLDQLLDPLPEGGRGHGHAP